ncbi:DedA family protein [Deinococcus aluminii]|uniref:VTT domain-containing protein n=1 Tax=Deinococcus aluminii TaxID=1656885 RepID=A0ABP9XCA6_9DEIO
MNLNLWLSGLDPTLLNAATFGLLTLEGAGIPGVPGVLPMLAQSALIDAGRTSLAAALTWGVLGNWLGSLLGYAAGRWGQRWLPPRWQAAIRQPRNLDLLERWGAPLIVVSRTVGSLRTPVTLVAGMTHYPWPRYLLLSLLGALLHVGVWQTVLWRLGPAVLPQIEHYGAEGLAAVLLAALLLWLLRGRRGCITPQR